MTAPLGTPRVASSPGCAQYPPAASDTLGTTKAPRNAWRRNSAYGLLAAPLAMAALPLFVQLPAYYATHAGVPLAALGWVLFAARLIDMLQDPVLGHLIDRAGKYCNRWMIAAAVLLALAFAGLWLPPHGPVLAAYWLGILLVLAYGAHSTLQISYLAWGARLPEAGLGAVAWREGVGLAGGIAASVLPTYLLSAPPQEVAGRLTAYSASFGLLLGASLACMLRAAPRAREQSTPAVPSVQVPQWRSSWHALRANRPLRALIPAYLMNALSVSIPATLALFFINDRLHAATMAGSFLACYFGAAALGLPAWTALARRVGALRAWRFGMLLSVAGFATAAMLGKGDSPAYFALCLIAGVALGADLALPPVLLAQNLGTLPAAGAAFGIFTLIGKLALALSGLTLPVLAMLGYQPGRDSGPALSIVYAGLPCLLKLGALVALPRPHCHHAVTEPSA